MELYVYVFANAVVVKILSKTSEYALIMCVSFQDLMYAQPLVSSQFLQDR